MIHLYCIYFLVHGFVKAEYNAYEGVELETLFQINVKGETAFHTLNTSQLSGSISAEPCGTASKIAIATIFNETMEHEK